MASNHQITLLRRIRYETGIFSKQLRVNILVANQDWFVEQWRAAGHHVRTCGLGGRFDVDIKGPPCSLNFIISKLDGFYPDVIVVFDNSAPVFFSGLEETLIPTFYYSVDTHHHAELHKYLSRVFDDFLIAQKDYAEPFRKFGSTPEWMPLWASRAVEPSNEKKFGAVFVGTLDSHLNPSRVEFFAALQNEVPVTVTRGEWWKIFPHAEIVINQTVKGDLNFRVFEAMMSGALLLTEHSDNGLLELFQNKVHLVTYPKGDVTEAARLIKYYLANPQEAQVIAKAGRAEILKSHTLEHRSEVLLTRLATLKKTQSEYRCFSAATNYVQMAYSLGDVDTDRMLLSLVNVFNAAERGLNGKEKFEPESTPLFVLAGFAFDWASGKNLGALMLLKLSNSYPDVPMLQLAKIRILLDQGNLTEARRIASILCPNRPVEDLFRDAERIVDDILSNLTKLKAFQRAVA